MATPPLVLSRSGRRWLKRGVDLVVGTCCFVIAVPLMVILALGLAVSLRCWPVFIQVRVGYRGKPFRLIKLRTLPPLTDPSIDKYQLSPNDIPRLAKWLRKTHLDELPQLLLVATGRMSLVGPRPEMPHLHETIDTHVASARVRVRPGCTGLWQIGADSHRLIREVSDYDLFYVDAVGPALDAWILARTVRVMLTGRGHVRLCDVPAWATPAVRAVGTKCTVIATGAPYPGNHG